MSEKFILEPSKETLKLIQSEQKANGVGMVESAKIPDQDALRFLLRRGDVYEPQLGMIKSAVELKSEDANAQFPDHNPWVWKTPKPKKKGNAPEQYEFLTYPDWDALPNAVAEALRPMGFADAPFLYEGYSYRKMAGGALRRKMVGSHSKEDLLSELKQIRTEEELAQLKQKIEDAVAEYRGKGKQFPEVQVCSGILFYPKDGSFEVKE
jgi:hypothetical protein